MLFLKHVHDLIVISFKIVLNLSKFNATYIFILFDHLYIDF